MTPPLHIDPRWFHPDAVAPETAQFNAAFEANYGPKPSILELGAAQTRALRREGKGPFTVHLPASETAEDREVAFDGQRVKVRIFRPDAGPIQGVYLHIHGGGWCLGAADQQDGMLQPLAQRAGIAVVSVEYRLAPEHPFPAGPDDCEVAARWLLAEGPVEFGTDRFVIGGESAGAHLTVVTLLRLRDATGATGFCGVNLVYGSYDLTMTPSARNWGDRRLVLSTPIIEWFVDRFVPVGQYPIDQRQAPDRSPLFANLERLGPALFIVGTMDPLLDDTLMMAGRWVGAGNPADLAVFPGAIHGFDMFDMPLARASHERQAHFIRSCVSPADQA